MKSKNFDCTLYLVTDRKILGERSLIDAIEEAILGGVSLVQLREKDISSREFYQLACQVKEITDKYNIPLIINDRLDIALAVDAAGLHIGQADLPAKIARRLLGKNKILGVSAGTLQEALQAEKDGADYLGVGAVFPTNSKDDAIAVDLGELAKIKSNVQIPIVGIGGINRENVHLLKESKIDGISIISAILGQENIKEAAQTLLEKFRL